MGSEFVLKIPYQQILFPFNKEIGSFNIWDDGNIRSIKSLQSNLLATIANIGLVEFKEPILLKNHGLNRIQELLCNTAQSRQNGGLYLQDFKISISKEQEISFLNKSVWYLDLPTPTGCSLNLIINNKYLPTEFPLMMPVHTGMVWPISTWSDYLFSTLWYSLFEPYFNLKPDNVPIAIIGSTCRISNSAILIPPYSIGNNVTIEAGAIVSGSIIGDSTRIGQGSIVRNSILAEGISLPINVTILMSIVNSGCVLNSQIRFSVIDENVFIGGNVSLTDVILASNQETYRQKKNILLEQKNGFVDSGSTVLGCGIGANVRIGSNVLITPGTSILPGTRVLPK